MIFKKYTYLLVLLCTTLLSFSQDDDSMTLLKDADDNLIKFENHYFEALKYKAIGNYTRAITELEKCQQLFSDNTAVAFELSKNNLLVNKLEEARLYIEKAMQQDANNIWLFEHAKKIYLKQFNYSKATAVQQKIVTINPKKKEDLILIYLQANKYKEADKLIKELEDSHQVSSRISRYKTVIANHFKRKSKIEIEEVKPTTNQTLDELKRTFDNDKQFSVLKNILEQELANANFENLLLYSNKGLDLFPAQPFIYLTNAKALIWKKKYTEAIDVLNNGIDFVIDDISLETDFYKQLISCYQATNNTEQVQKYEKKVTKLLNKQ